VSYAKRPFAGPEAVVKYIGHYTHKAAIANSRSPDIDHHEIRFRYKDYKDEGKGNEKAYLLCPNCQSALLRFVEYIMPRKMSLFFARTSILFDSSWRDVSVEKGI
jgi:hypothetical protein